MSVSEVTRELAVSVFATLSDEKLAEFVHLFGNDNKIALLESKRLLDDPNVVKYNNLEEFVDDAKMGSTKYTVFTTSIFRQDLKLVERRGYDTNLLFDVVTLLAKGEPLPEEYKDHPLFGEWKGYRECHIKPDWLLVYSVSNNTLVLLLVEMGDVQ